MTTTLRVREKLKNKHYHDYYNYQLTQLVQRIFHVELMSGRFFVSRADVDANGRRGVASNDSSCDAVR